MALTNDEVGILLSVLGAAALVLFIAIVIFACNRHPRGCLSVLRFAHPQSRCSRRPNNRANLHMHSMLKVQQPQHDMESQEQSDGYAKAEDEQWEKYGELYIAQNHKPTNVAIDIINQMLMKMGLPGNTQWPARPRVAGHRASSLQVDLPRHDSLIPSEQVNYLMGNGNSTVGAHESEITNPWNHTSTAPSAHDAEQSDKGTKFLELVKSVTATKTQPKSKKSTLEEKAQKILSGEWSDIASEEVKEFRDDDGTVEPVAGVSGSGKSLAAFYR